MQTLDAARLGPSWRPGCPVGPDQLRILTVPYWGFDGTAHQGQLVVHVEAVDALRGAFARLLVSRFPIRKIVPIDAYGASDEASTADDNTSAFNCREAVRSDGVHVWSQHAYGLAVDVNPVENPYLEGGRVLPANASAFVDRTDLRPGMAAAGNELNTAFAEVGWGWGGTWSSPDYQHFSASGR